MFIGRCRTEYNVLSPHPEKWPQLINGLGLMWRREPNFGAKGLADVTIPTTVSDGELVSNVASNPVAKHLDIRLRRCSNRSFRTHCSFQVRTALLNRSGKIVVNCCPQSRRNDA
jgi:hypothetical protein